MILEKGKMYAFFDSSNPFDSPMKEYGFEAEIPFIVLEDSFEPYYVLSYLNSNRSFRLWKNNRVHLSRVKEIK